MTNFKNLINELQTERDEITKNALAEKMDRRKRRNICIPFERKVKILEIINQFEEFEETKIETEIKYSYLKNDDFFNGLDYFLEMSENREFKLLNIHIKLNKEFNQQISLLRD